MSKFILILPFLFAGILSYSCSTAPEFDRDNENDPDSEIFVPDAPSNSDAKLSMDSLGNVHFIWNRKMFIDGYSIKKRYDSSSPFEELATSISTDTSFTDSSKTYSLETRYELSFFRLLEDSSKRFSEIPIGLPLIFRPFQYLDVSYNSTTKELFINSDYRNRNSDPSVKYYDGIYVEINRSSLSESWEPLITFGKEYINNEKLQDGIGIDLQLFDLNLRAFQFIEDSSGTKHFLKSGTLDQYINSPDDVDFQFIDELSGTIRWRNTLNSYDGVILSGSVIDTLYNSSSVIDISFNPAPVPPVRIGVKLFIDENYSMEDQSNNRYPNVYPPDINSFVSISNSSAQLGWNNSPSEHTAGYIIEQKTDIDSKYNIIDTLSRDVKGYTLNNLESSNEYNYRIRTYTSDYSEEANIKFLTALNTLESEQLSTPGYNYFTSKSGKYIAKHVPNPSTSYNDGSIWVLDTETNTEYVVDMKIYPDSHRPSIIDFVVSEESNSLIFIGDNHSTDNSGDYLSVYDFVNEIYIHEAIPASVYGEFGFELDIMNDDKTLVTFRENKINLFDIELGEFTDTFQTQSGSWVLNKTKDSIYVCSESGIFEYQLTSGSLINQVDDICSLALLENENSSYFYLSISGLKKINLDTFSVETLSTSLDQLDEIRVFWFFEEDNLLIYRSSFSSYKAEIINTENKSSFSLPTFDEDYFFGIHDLERNEDGTYHLTSYDGSFILELGESWSLIENE